MTFFCESASLAFMLPCLAYIGPGPGLTMIWALIGLLATILTALSAIALWPLRLLFKRLRENRSPESACDQVSAE